MCQFCAGGPGGLARAEAPCPGPAGGREVSPSLCPFPAEPEVEDAAEELTGNGCLTQQGLNPVPKSHLSPCSHPAAPMGAWGHGAGWGVSQRVGTLRGAQGRGGGWALFHLLAGEFR